VHWIALGQALGQQNIDLMVLWGTPEEYACSQRIAATLPRAHVGERKPLDAVARLIAGAQFVVGVDTGLTHLAAALGVPLVAIFVGSKPGLTGPVGSGPITVLGAEGKPPAVADVIDAVEALVAKAAR
jgi:heptosyltransferase-1